MLSVPRSSKVKTTESDLDDLYSVDMSKEMKKQPKVTSQFSS